MGIPIPDFPDYLIETDGRIFSKKRNRWLKYQISPKGYCYLELSNSKGRKRMSVHRLVATAYIPNPDNFPQVNHKDENKQNNNVSNLEWCTAKYNMNYGTVQERIRKNTDFTKPIYKINAIKNGKRVSKSILMLDKKGNCINRFVSAKEASRRTNTHYANIIACCKFKRQSAGGYIWKYEGSEDLSVYQL